MYNTENEKYSLATCPGTKYSDDIITLKVTPSIIIDSSRLGNQP